MLDVFNVTSGAQELQCCLPLSGLLITTRDSIYYLDTPMAATEDNSIILGLDDEVEGERIGSDDYCFIETGEAVPIKPGDDAEFDPQNPPSKPLSVSERFGLIFVSHSTGTFSLAIDSHHVLYIGH